MITVSCPLNPSITENLMTGNLEVWGGRFVMEVPLGTTLKDLKWIQKPNKPNASIETKTVEGSKGNTYTLRKLNDKWTCSCPGFKFRRNCKHTKTMK